MVLKRKTSGTRRRTMTLGARIRLERQYKGWTQNDLAAASGVSVDAIASIETDARAMVEGECQRIADALRITVEKLTHDETSSAKATKRGLG